MQKTSFLKQIFSGKRKYIAILVVLVAIIWFVSSNNSKNNGKQETVIATLQTVAEEVLVSGTVKPMEAVDLAFEKSGTVARVYKSVGEGVYAGETIVTLENGTEISAWENATAQLDLENAKLAELKMGSRPEEIKVKESELAEAVQTLKNYYSSVPATISDAFNKADSAVNKQADPVYSNDQSANPDLNFNVSDQQAKNDALISRITATKIIDSFRILNDSLLTEEKSQEKKDEALLATKSFLLQIQSFLVKTSTVLNNTTNVSDSTLSTYKDNIATARTNVNTAIQNISTLIDDISSQKISIEKNQRELDLAKLGSTAEVISQQMSAIAKAEASVKSATSAILKTNIRSPINGVVSKQDAKVGELASAGANLVSVISSQSYKIEANIPEADLAKIAVGNKAEVTLDSYGNSVAFEATLISIDPAETIVDGVSTYKTTFALDTATKPVRSGMTANLTIKTAEKVNALALPQRALTTGESGKVAQVLNADGTITEKVVTTGVRGSDGMIEILSGISEGETVVIPGKAK